MEKVKTVTQLFLLFSAFAAMAVAQTPAELRGIVADELGAIIRKASITLDDGKGSKLSTQTDGTGHFRFTGLAPGTYTLTATAPGFAAGAEQVKLNAGGATSVNLVLKVTISEQVDVKSDAVGVSIEPDQNLSAMNLSRNDLASLPDDREELLQVLRAMAGGSDTAPIFVDGFSEDRLPSKNSIQAVKIGSNPFSPEFSGRGNNRIQEVVLIWSTTSASRAGSTQSRPAHGSNTSATNFSTAPISAEHSLSAPASSGTPRAMSSPARTALRSRSRRSNNTAARCSGCRATARRNFPSRPAIRSSRFR